jgi:hypothetical protein
MYALAGTYQIQTSIPLVGSFNATIPVADITQEALAEVKAQLWWVALGALGIVVVGGVVANWIMPARRV